MKNFNAWNDTKQQLDGIDDRPPFVSEGDIWWVSIGENIGAEVGGKSRLFSRPAIIFKKLAQHFYLVIPTTTREKMVPGTSRSHREGLACARVFIKYAQWITADFPQSSACWKNTIAQKSR